MNRIRLLPEHVANQIAAGEVVERPASVVKELVENALDAEASRITLEIQSGGRMLVRVTDDGVGMSRDDALLCLERHATSKIQKAEDLSRVLTMGFRGEALPSIASVSRFVLTTRERTSSSPEATQIIVQGGKVVEVKAAGAPSGTTVEVRQLFFNLPARKKFLRSDDTEFAHIHHYFTVAALAHPHVGFTLIKDQKTVLQLPAEKAGDRTEAELLEAVGQRLRLVLGDGVPLLPVEHAADLPFHRPAHVDADAFDDLNSGRIRVWGYIGKPGVSRSSRDHHYVFVNRRPIENRGVNFALMEGYHTALMKGQYPVCCLFLEMDPARVDVNIHPTKREVKFHQESEIRRFVAQAIRQALLKFHRPPAAVSAMPPRLPDSVPSVGGSKAAQVPDAGLVGASGMMSTAVVPTAIPMELIPGPQPELGGVGAREVVEARGTPDTPWKEAKPAEGGAALEAVFSAPPAAASTTVRPVEVAETEMQVPAVAKNASVVGTGGAGVWGVSLPSGGRAGAPTLEVPLRLLGVIGQLYVILESDRGLVLMDQHAAHERILFEQMLNRLENGEIASQRLLLPETVELSTRDAHWVRGLLPMMTRMGIGLSEFGERTFLLDALPPFVRVKDGRRFAMTLIDELRLAGEDVNRVRLGEEVVAKTVCRHAVKANDPLKGPELERLVADLRRCQMPYTCPHGRPTLIEMSFKELEKKFGRLV